MIFAVATVEDSLDVFLQDLLDNGFSCMPCSKDVGSFIKRRDSDTIICVWQQLPLTSVLCSKAADLPPIFCLHLLVQIQISSGSCFVLNAAIGCAGGSHCTEQRQQKFCHRKRRPSAPSAFKHTELR